MAQLQWQTPPFPGRKLASFGSDGRFALQHDQGQLRIHEGLVEAATGRGAGGRTGSYGGLYWSRYEFQVQPDDATDVGPWDAHVVFTLGGRFFKVSMLDSGAGEAKVVARATITRLRDGSPVYRRVLQDTATVGPFDLNLRPSVLSASDLDVVSLDAEEYRLDLWTFARATAVRPRFATRETRTRLRLEWPSVPEFILIVT